MQTKREADVIAKRMRQKYPGWLPTPTASNRAVIVAVIAVRMMQMSIDEIVDVIAMRDRCVAAIRSMHMRGVVARAVMVRCAIRRVLRADFERVLFDRAVLTGVMKMTVMRVVDVVAVLHRRVAASRPVLMFVAFVMVVLSHARLLQGLLVHGDASRARMRS